MLEQVLAFGAGLYVLGICANAATRPRPIDYIQAHKFTYGLEITLEQAIEKERRISVNTPLWKSFIPFYECFF